MNANVSSATPVLEWRNQPRSFWRWLGGKLPFWLLVAVLAALWFGFKHLLTVEGITLSQSEVPKFKYVPLFIPMGSIGLYQLSRLLCERAGWVQDSSQTVHREPQFPLAPILEPIVIGEDRLPADKIKKCALSFVACGLMVYFASAWPLYRDGWTRHTLAFEVLAALNAILAAFLVGVVPFFVDFVRSLTLRIDEAGVTSRTLCGAQFVPWERIATSKMVRSRPIFEAQTVLVLTLQDSGSKTLLNRGLYVSDATLTRLSQTMLRMLSVA